MLCTFRFSSPLIKPDVRISRIRLSDWFHGWIKSERLAAGSAADEGYPNPQRSRSC
jgi:hypothetical protein